MIKPLIIKDKIYGKYKITEPVLIELIKSAPVQRLKKINQHGLYSNVFYGIVNRYQHSVGVMLLAKQFKASISEQIAGLFHDISHTAFSHVVDHALSRAHLDNFHEDYTHYILKSSKVPQILKKYNLPVKYVTNEKNFPLIDRPEPHLCADRLDYFLRDSYICFKFLNQRQIKKILKNLTVISGQWVFKDKKIAKFFAQKFIHAAKFGWYSGVNHANHYLMGRVIKIALNKKYIAKKDLFSYDKKLLAKIRKIEDQDINRYLKMLKNLKAEINFKDYDFLSVAKFRAVDPLILIKDQLIKLTAVDKNFKKELADYKTYIDQSIPIKILT